MDSKEDCRQCEKCALIISDVIQRKEKKMAGVFQLSIKVVDKVLKSRKLVDNMVEKTGSR